MKRILNPAKWMQRKGELDKLIADAIKHHRPRADLIRERQSIVAGLIAYENREYDRRAA